MEKETSINLIEDVVSARAEEKSVDFPEDWVECDLGDVCDLYQPKTISSKNLIPNGKYVVYGANGIIGKYNKYNHKDEQLLMTCRGASCGNMHISQKYAWINGNAMVINPYRKDLLSLFYLKYYFSNRNVTSKAITGSAQPQITRTNLQSLNFPFPPLPIQRAIVQKIEALFSSLDSGIADLKKAQEQLTIYRQAVLKKAFEGELINVRFERIQIKEIGEILTGNTPSKKKAENYNSRDYNFYKPSDLDVGINVTESNDFLSEKGYENCRQVPIDSILITCIGATIGKTGLIKKEGGFNQQINAIIPNNDYNSKFIFYQAIGIDFQTQIKINASSTTLPILNKGKFSLLEMNVCDKEEQNAIVREIESRLSVCDAVEKNIAESLEKAESLRQSILKKAFEGKLLTAAEIEQCKREADYEPAEVLLERIRNEKNGK